MDKRSRATAGNSRFSVVLTILAAGLMAATSSAMAAECRSIAGQLNGERVSVVRNVSLKKGRIILSGKMNGRQMPRQTLTCKTIAKGVYCDGIFQGAIVTVMTNGKRMTETASDTSGTVEAASFAYLCDRLMKP
ncbi:hypothetical protein [Ensifer soli]|uniref:hypothetical protein n=1 Tax=Ciceribacter sp. sgz301302 TaxID=3342379 RepID=UPI0035B982ED